MKTIEQRIIAKQDEYIVIADKILGEWECSGCALTEFRREIYALKAQLKEQEEKPEGTKITTDHEQIRDIVLQERDKGNIVYASFEGLISVPLDEVIKQPIDGLLYDLNRNESVVLTFIDDPKWVNDFAVATVIRKLHGMVI